MGAKVLQAEGVIDNCKEQIRRLELVAGKGGGRAVMHVVGFGEENWVSGVTGDDTNEGPL